MRSSQVVRAASVLELIAVGFFGIFVALLGTSAYRAYEPFALIFALLAVFVTAVMVRAWLGLLGTGVFGLAFLGAVQLFALSGPGGDVLMPADLLTYAWLFGGIAAIGVACFTPRKWYQEQERPAEAVQEQGQQAEA